MEKTNYNFPIRLQEIYTNGLNPKSKEQLTVQNKLAVVRADSGDVLGIVSKKYQVLKHEDVVNSFRKALAKTNYEEKIKIAKDGSSLYLTYSLNDEMIEIRDGDFVKLQFIVRNSYNGSSSLQIMLGAFRLVCTNGMIIGKKFFSFSQRHIGTGGEIKIEMIREKIEFLTAQFSKTLPVLQEMSEYSLGVDPEMFTPEAINLPEYLLKEAENNYMYDEDFTRWGFYNALTNAITHSMRKENPAAMIEYGRRAWLVAQDVQ
jgi:hypothetical protein